MKDSISIRSILEELTGNPDTAPANQVEVAEKLLLQLLESKAIEIDSIKAMYHEHKNNGEFIKAIPISALGIKE